MRGYSSWPQRSQGASRETTESTCALSGRASSVVQRVRAGALKFRSGEKILRMRPPAVRPPRSFWNEVPPGVMPRAARL
jgi:hypothetical protein